MDKKEIVKKVIEEETFEFTESEEEDEGAIWVQEVDFEVDS